MKRNPIYQALRVTGILEKMIRKHGDDSGIAAVKYRFVQDRAALRSLYLRGIITFDEHRDLRDRVARPFHAAVMRLAMATSPLPARRRATMTVQRICPPGTTSYDFRMGNRRDVA